MSSEGIPVIMKMKRPHRNSNRVCILTHGEIIAYVQHGHLPNCKAHRHCTRKQALKQVDGNNAYLLPELSELGAIVEHESNGYVWKSRMSAGFNVRQMVRVVQG